MYVQTIYFFIIVRLRDVSNSYLYFAGMKYHNSVGNLLYATVFKNNCINLSEYMILSLYSRYYSSIHENVYLPSVFPYLALSISLDENFGTSTKRRII